MKYLLGLSIFLGACYPAKIISYTKHLQAQTILIQNYTLWEKQNGDTITNPMCINVYKTSKEKLLAIIDGQSAIINELVGISTKTP